MFEWLKEQTVNEMIVIKRTTYHFHNGELVESTTYQHKGQYLSDEVVKELFANHFLVITDEVQRYDVSYAGIRYMHQLDKKRRIAELVAELERLRHED